MGACISHWMNAFSSQLGDILGWCHPPVIRSSEWLTENTQRPYQCCADKRSGGWSKSLLANVTHHKLQVWSKCSAFISAKHVFKPFLRNLLPLVRSRNHHRNNRTSLSGWVRPPWQHHLSNPPSARGDWPPDKSFKAYYSLMRLLRVLKRHPLWLLLTSACVCVCREFMRVWARSEAMSY